MLFIIGGAFGNLIDRIFLGYVRDFIKFEFITFQYSIWQIHFWLWGVLIFCVFIVFFSPP